MQLPSFPSAIVGRTVTSVGRVLYEHRAVIEPVDGALEIGVDGRLILLDAAADGERLRVREQAWNDPFEKPLSRENEAYVKEHGRWRRVDCSRQEPYSELLGQSVTDVRFLENEWHHVAGVRLSVAARSLWFVVAGDECRVYWAHPIGFRE